MSSRCYWIFLELSSSSQPTGACCPLSVRGPSLIPLVPLLSLPASGFPSTRSSSSLPILALLLPVCLGFSSSSFHLSPPAPLCAFSRQAPNGKHLFPGALQQSLLLFFLRHPDLTLHPELVPVSLLFLPEPRPHPVRSGDGTHSSWATHTPSFQGEPCRQAGPGPRTG